MKLQAWLTGALAMHFCTSEFASREPLGHFAASPVDSAALIRSEQAASDLYSFFTSALYLSMQTEPAVGSVLGGAER